MLMIALVNSINFKSGSNLRPAESCDNNIHMYHFLIIPSFIYHYYCCCDIFEWNSYFKKKCFIYILSVLGLASLDIIKLRPCGPRITKFEEITRQRNAIIFQYFVILLFFIHPIWIKGNEIIDFSKTVIHYFLSE